jgi:hypothetical protein
MNYTGFIGDLFSYVVLVTACIIFMTGAVGVFAWILNHLVSWTIDRVKHSLRLADILTSAIFYKIQYKKNKGEFAAFHEWRMERLDKQKEANHES